MSCFLIVLYTILQISFFFFKLFLKKSCFKILNEIGIEWPIPGIREIICVSSRHSVLGYKPGEGLKNIMMGDACIL